MAKSVTPLRTQANGLLFGFGLQFLAGMLLNLFVTLPNNHPGTSGNEYFSRSGHSLIWALSGHGGWELSAHVYLAILLVLGTAALSMNAIILHNKSWAIVGGSASLLTIGALFNGLSYLNYSHNVSSMIMASCWLLAVGALIYGSVCFKKA